jgi:hypothetical protein
MNESFFSDSSLFSRKQTSKTIARQMQIPNNVRFAFDAILQTIYKNKWYGSCHATSAMLFIVLETEGYAPHLHLGQCRTDKYFDHSWVTLDNQIYDAAIAFDLADKQYVGPTFAGIDLDTKQETTLQYGNSSLPFDDQTLFIATSSITTYLDGKSTIWRFLQNVFERVSVPFDEVALKEKYRTVKWIIEPVKWEVTNLDDFNR